jgi:hypothetical protein
MCSTRISSCIRSRWTIYFDGDFLFCMYFLNEFRILINDLFKSSDRILIT